MFFNQKKNKKKINNFVHFKLRRNVIDVSYHISQYQQIIQELAAEITSLRDQRSDLESRISHLDPRLSVTNGEDKSKIEEALKLRESLLQSFKQQIKLRKNVLELDNAIMDLNIEADRHTKIIESWESHKENEINNSPDGKSKKFETTANSVLNAKEELKVVEQDRDELETKRKDTVKELDALKQKTKKLRDVAGKKLTNSEQKEILNLLLKNFEFEIKNIEMQADIFKRDFKLREQDLVILRLEQHRSLCDTLIFQQRRLIVDNNLQIPTDLDELYFLYSRDVDNGQLIRDINSVRSTSNSSLAANSPKPNTNAFLTQIQEENADQSVHSATPTNYDDVKDISWTKNSNEKLDNHNFDKMIFQKSNKIPQVNHNNNNNKATMKKSKDQNYYFINGNYISSNGHGGLVSQSIGLQNAFNNSKNNNNNISMLSSSTNDSNMEVILENVPSTVNKQLINTPPRINGKYGIGNSGIVPPGQVVSNNLSLGAKNKNNNNSSGQIDRNSNAKRLTQGIAAIAAQRKASQHHKELMQELGHKSNSQVELLTTSRLAKHDQALANQNLDDGVFEKKNSVLTDGSNKAKKQVKIKDIVQFKLPDDTYSTDDNITVREFFFTFFF